jgi:beta-mannosidase
VYLLAVNFTAPLDRSWQFKQRDTKSSLAEDFASPAGWLGANVPGNIYQDLLEAGRIPDPFYGMNEHQVQWVAEADWLYRGEFEVTAEQLAEPFIDLCFEGLDTFATVWLNAQQVLQSDNMFVPRRVDVKSKLQPGPNHLRILFESALRKGREIQATHGKRGLWNGDSSRLYVRKAQYHYGWDWGPVLMTAGPWKDIRLEAYSTRISNVHCPTEVSPDLQKAILPIQVELAGNTDQSQVQLTLLDPSGHVVHQSKHAGAQTLKHQLKVPQPQLWWPNGYGQQPLYRLKVELLTGNQIISEQSLGLGMRRLRVVQEPVEGETGTSFYFEVNNLPIFAAGANWIPEDHFLNRISRERYFERVKQAAEANMVMLRVWGGGIYEDDAFYDACDEMGILVWQDFMFACGLYPAHAEFLQSVRAEAEAAVHRLRHRASLALWCGNNEDYAVAESVGWYGPGKDSGPFVAREIYEKLLPEVCAEHDPTRLYWPGSPYTPGGALSSDQSIGDRHTWEVWHGAMHPYQQYIQFEGRFISEFGMQAYPSMSALEQSIPAEERFPQSRTMEHHNKAGPTGQRSDGHRRLAVYLSDNLPDPLTLEGYIYATQFIQAEALHYAFRDFRRRWGRAGKRAVGGALVWQINDCWPVVSWAVIDSLGIPKPAYYVMRRGLAPFALGLQGGQVWAANSTSQEAGFELEIKVFDLQGQNLYSQKRRVRLAANATSELGEWEYPSNEPVVASVRLLKGLRVVARTALWPQPFKFYRFPDPGLKIEQIGEGFRLSVEKPAKGVWLEAGKARWSDNFIDLMPGDAQVVQAKGLSGEVKVRWLVT